MIDNDSCENIVLIEIVKKLYLKIDNHLKSYKLI
jgi:hypothetical protein